jgi:hypothetical protein
MQLDQPDLQEIISQMNGLDTSSITDAEEKALYARLRGEASITPGVIPQHGGKQNYVMGDKFIMLPTTP